jgi:SAM-dependent methyltransferase
MTRSPINWDAYLADFHARFPGITEDVLARSSSGGLTPYGWLTEGITSGFNILDLGCGSGPAQPPTATRWVGLDRSRGELQRAVELGRDTLLQGDITQLPIAERTVDVVTSSMAMMLVHPIEQALSEIRRVLRNGGELRLLLPTPTPLTTLDRLTYLRLFWAARSTTKFPPTTMRGSARRTLEANGFTVVSDERARFEHLIEGPVDGDRFINSWYLPSTPETRRSFARERAAAMAPFRVGIPLRRIVAR